MRIDAYNKVNQLYQTTVKKKEVRAGSQETSDQLQISQYGKDYQIAKQAVKQVSDVRMDKVEELKHQMENGTYDLSASGIANKLVNRFFDTTI